MNIKKVLLLLTIIMSSLSINAKGVIFYNAGDDIIKVVDLPMRDEFKLQAQDGKWYHANLGILHEQFSIFWIPLWNYGEERYVLYSDVKVGEYDFTYYDLSKEDISYIQSLVGGVPSTPEIPFWDMMGGKILAGLVLFLLLAVKGND